MLGAVQALQAKVDGVVKPSHYVLASGSVVPDAVHMLCCQVQWNQLSDSVGVVQNKAEEKCDTGADIDEMVGLHVGAFLAGLQH